MAKKKLIKVIEAMHALLQETSATVTLKWPDGRYAIISRHGYNVRIPEKLTMEPVDSLELHTLETTNSIGTLLANHATIQGEPKAPWMTDDSKPT